MMDSTATAKPILLSSIITGAFYSIVVGGFVVVELAWLYLLSVIFIKILWALIADQ